jgi:hypothetical protein
MVPIADQKLDRYQPLQRMDTSDYWLHVTTSQLSTDSQNIFALGDDRWSNASPG